MPAAASGALHGPATLAATLPGGQGFAPNGPAVVKYRRGVGDGANAQWYPDPSAPGNGQLRYWDGQAWTAHTCTPIAGGPAQAGGPVPAAGGAPFASSATWRFETGAVRRRLGATDPGPTADGRLPEPDSPLSRPRPSAWEYAGWFSRVFAALVDSVVLVVLIFLVRLVVLAMAHFSRSGLVVALLAGVVVAFFYVVVALARSGQTFGMRLLTIRCVQASDGRYPIGLGRSLLRWVLAFSLGFIPFANVVDLLWPLWDPCKQTLHDKAVGTAVVRT